MGLKATPMGDGYYMISGWSDQEDFKTFTTEEEAKKEHLGADYIECAVTSSPIYWMNGMREETHDVPPWIGYQWNGYRKSSLEDLKNIVERARLQWKESDEGKAFKMQLQERKLRQDLVPVTNIIALGIGTLQLWHHSEETQRRSARQLAAFLTIKEELLEAGSHVHCIVQDPAYSILEKEFLTSLGLECVNDPEAFYRVDEGSLVFSIGTYFSIFYQLSFGIWPAALICGDAWLNVNDKLSNEAPETVRQTVNAMFQGCERVCGPRSSEEWGENLFLFWRKVRPNAD